MKEDCFAFDGRICRALVHANCGDCVFYKTREQAEADRERAAERLESLKTNIFKGEHRT